MTAADSSNLPKAMDGRGRQPRSTKLSSDGGSTERTEVALSCVGCTGTWIMELEDFTEAYRRLPVELALLTGLWDKARTLTKARTFIPVRCMRCGNMTSTKVLPIRRVLDILSSPLESVREEFEAVLLTFAWKGGRGSPPPKIPDGEWDCDVQWSGSEKTGVVNLLSDSEDDDSDWYDVAPPRGKDVWDHYGYWVPILPSEAFNRFRREGWPARVMEGDGNFIDGEPFPPKEHSRRIPKG